MPHEWRDLKEVLGKGKVRVKCRKCDTYWPIDRPLIPNAAGAHFNHNSDCDPGERAGRDVTQALDRVRAGIEDIHKLDLGDFIIEVEVEVPR